jgi:site-specific recombinase XerD
MELHFTTREFEVHGVPKPGVPFLVDSDMEFVGPANDYLFEVSVVKGRVRSSQSWQTYGKHLYDYFDFLEANGFSWDKSDRAHIVAWRDSMIERGNDATTVNNRLRTIARYYDWAFNRKLIKELPFDREDIKVRKGQSRYGDLDTTGGRVHANELTLRTPRSLPKFLLWKRAAEFVSHLNPHRNKLIGHLMLLSGLRLEEAASLDFRVLPRTHGYASNEAIPMVLDPSLTPTKGSVERLVYVPYDLIYELVQYLTYERGRLEKTYKRRTGEPQKSTKLFLNQWGEPVSLKGVAIAFQDASKRSKIKATPHAFRHTFATYEFLRESEERGRDGALHWLQQRLGHASIETTRIYLHTADLVKHKGLDDLHIEVCKQLRESAGDRKTQKRN